MTLKPEMNIPIVGTIGMGAEILEKTDHSIKVRMPLKPNANHVGCMYAGCIFSLAEFPVGEIFVPQLDPKVAIMLVGKANITYLKPAFTDITTEFVFEEGLAKTIQNEVASNGKFAMNYTHELKDAHGDVVAITEIRYVAFRPPTLA